MTRLIYDNIIFSLQKSGGISLLWSEMLCRLLADDRFSTLLLEYDNAKQNFFHHDWDVDLQKSSKFLQLKRYLNPTINIDEPHIFHSSYYRTSDNRKAINITTVHDFTYEHFVRGFAQKVHSWQKRDAILKSQKIICISENTKRDLLNLISGVDEKSTSVIYNGVSDIFRKNEQSYIGDYVVFVGLRGGYKNFEMAVRAVKLAGCRLIAVGGGELSSAEREMTDRLLGAKFEKLGNISTEKLCELYNNAIALVYPSLYEGFGIPVIEAQKSACPVIASYGSSIPEIIGDTKIVLENISTEAISESILKLSSDSRLRTNEIESGLQNSKRFTWDNTYEQLSELYLTI